MFLTTHPPQPTRERLVHEAIFAVYAIVWVIDIHMGGEATMAIWIYTAATATLSVLWRMYRPPAADAADKRRVDGPAYIAWFYGLGFVMCLVYAYGCRYLHN